MLQPTDLVVQYLSSTNADISDSKILKSSSLIETTSLSLQSSTTSRVDVLYSITVPQSNSRYVSGDAAYNDLTTRLTTSVSDGQFSFILSASASVFKNVLVLAPRYSSAVIVQYPTLRPSTTPSTGGLAPSETTIESTFLSFPLYAQVLIPFAGLLLIVGLCCPLVYFSRYYTVSQQSSTSADGLSSANFGSSPDKV